MSESKFELQSIKADQEDDQRSDLNLTQILLRFDSELKQESKINEDSNKEVIFIQNQIIVENWMNQLCIDIQAVVKQNRRICQDIDLNNCRVLDEVLWKDDRLWISQSMITVRDWAKLKILSI